MTACVSVRTADTSDKTLQGGKCSYSGVVQCTLMYIRRNVRMLYRIVPLYKLVRTYCSHTICMFAHYCVTILHPLFAHPIYVIHGISRNANFSNLNPAKNSLQQHFFLGPIIKFIIMFRVGTEHNQYRQRRYQREICIFIFICCLK